MRKLNLKTLAATLAVAVSVALPAAAQEADGPILFTNVNVFDGVNEALIMNANVVVTGNKITAVSTEPLAVAGGTVIDGGGRTLMPGLIDAHWHSLFATLSVAELITNDLAYMSFKGAIANEGALMRGFTTVRDIGGNVFSIKKATDEGLINGPRIYPSGAVISQTSGHGDYRAPLAVPENPGQPLDYLQQAGIGIIADGVPEVIKRSREILRQGASQLKVMAGGGVSSDFDPLDVTQYTFAEMSALVEVANTWNTYIAVHAFTDTAVKQALEAGVKSIEHGHLLGEDVIKLLAEKGAWLSMQPILDDEDAIPFPEGSLNRAKFVTVTAGTDIVYGYAKKHGAKIAWGTDVLFDAGLAAKQGKLLAKMKRWFTPFEVLKMATHDNAQLLKLSGPRDPYPGELGVVKAGALADLILVEGNLLENIDLVADPRKNFVLIMKDGVIYKNTID